MEARRDFVRALIVAGILCAGLSQHVSDLKANEPRVGNLRTRNFVVTAPDQQLASQIGFAAEKYRRELALEWLGKEIPDWPEPCVITAYIKPQAYGETSFSFAGQRGAPSQPFDFVMQVNGSRERILDSVLPHEVSHTIFATHFKQPLPRWADEGACTTVEHLSERRKNHRMLIEFLTTGRGIPFNRMFAMKNYPRDILPLYAQGYSLCRFLIQRGGKRKFIQFMGDGLVRSDWGGAIERHYNIDDLSELQVQWLNWVKNGCPRPDRDMVASTADTDFAQAFNRSQGIPESFSEKTKISAPEPANPSPTPVNPSVEENLSPTAGQNENFYLREIERSKSKTLLR